MNHRPRGWCFQNSWLLVLSLPYLCLSLANGGVHHHEHAQEAAGLSQAGSLTRLTPGRLAFAPASDPDHCFACEWEFVSTICGSEVLRVPQSSLFTSLHRTLIPAIVLRLFTIHGVRGPPSS